jgi:hypothetical protein
MEKIVCINGNCGQKFEMAIQEGARSKKIQCPHCSQPFFVTKEGGKIRTFLIDIANMAF